MLVRERGEIAGQAGLGEAGAVSRKVPVAVAPRPLAASSPLAAAATMSRAGASRHRSSVGWSGRGARYASSSLMWCGKDAEWLMILRFDTRANMDAWP